MNLARQIAATARESLGRPAKRSSWVDWQAADAVKAAAVAAGLTEPLSAWINESRLSLTGLATAYTTRYAEAYGHASLPIAVDPTSGHRIVGIAG